MCVCEGTKQDTENDLIIVKLWPLAFVKMNHPNNISVYIFFFPIYRRIRDF